MGKCARISRGVMAGVVLLALAAGGAAAQTVPLAVNSFDGASNLPIWVAQHEGFFRRHGLEVALSHPHGSVDQLQGVADGRFPVVTTAFDNVIAYHEGQGSPQVGMIPDLVAVMGIDSGFLTLVGAPSIAGVADLKGKTMAVDALSTGFSFALKAILAHNGVAPDQVSYVAVGSSENRLRALRDGRAAAALLTLPADLIAREAGDKALTTVTQVLGPYAANVAAVRQGWAQSHRAALAGFLSGYRDGLDWMLAPPHRQAAIAILHEGMPALPAAMLVPVFDEMAAPRTGLQRDPLVDPKAAQTVLSLRATYATPPHKLQPLAAYIDTGYVRTAAR